MVHLMISDYTTPAGLREDPSNLAWIKNLSTPSRGLFGFAYIRTYQSIKPMVHCSKMSRSAYLQLFSEFFPVVAFFVAGQFFSFYIAATVMIVTTLLSLIVSLVQFRHIPVMPLFSGAITFIFGGLTLWLEQPDFIIFADTFYFVSLALLIGIFFFRKKQLLEHMFDQTFAMTEAGWRVLSQRWFTILLLAGIANEIARYLLEPEVWIDYRFAKILLLIVFSFYQFTVSKKYRIPEESNALGLRI